MTNKINANPVSIATIKAKFGEIISADAVDLTTVKSKMAENLKTSPEEFLNMVLYLKTTLNNIEGYINLFDQVLEAYSREQGSCFDVEAEYPAKSSNGEVVKLRTTLKQELKTKTEVDRNGKAFAESVGLFDSSAKVPGSKVKGAYAFKEDVNDPLTIKITFPSQEVKDVFKVPSLQINPGEFDAKIANGTIDSKFATTTEVLSYGVSTKTQIVKD